MFLGALRATRELRILPKIWGLSQQLVFGGSQKRFLSRPKKLIHMWPRPQVYGQKKSVSPSPDFPPHHLKSRSEATFCAFRTQTFFPVWLSLRSSHLKQAKSKKIEKPSISLELLEGFTHIPIRIHLERISALWLHRETQTKLTTLIFDIFVKISTTLAKKFRHQRIPPHIT